MGIQNAGYLGDFAVGAAGPAFKVATYRDDTGAPAVPNGGLIATVYKDGIAAQSAAGLAITENFDGLGELVHFEINLGDDEDFYSAGSNFSVVMLGGAVNGVPLAPMAVASFSVKNRSQQTLPTPSEGDGDIPVDHNTGGTDALRYTLSGDPADDVTIKAYLKSEYDAGTRTVRGTAHTGVDGRWINPLMLDAGTYTLVAWIPGVSDPVKTDVVVS
jgi:hypothetical protein